jgi:hypothetical protein
MRSFESDVPKKQPAALLNAVEPSWVKEARAGDFEKTMEYNTATRAARTRERETKLWAEDQARSKGKEAEDHDVEMEDAEMTSDEVGAAVAASVDEEGGGEADSDGSGCITLDYGPSKRAASPEKESEATVPPGYVRTEQGFRRLVTNQEWGRWTEVEGLLECGGGNQWYLCKMKGRRVDEAEAVSGTVLRKERSTRMMVRDFRRSL